MVAAGKSRRENQDGNHNTLVENLSRIIQFLSTKIMKTFQNRKKKPCKTLKNQIGISTFFLLKHQFSSFLKTF